MTFSDALYLHRQLWGANPATCSAGRYLGAGAFHGLIMHHDVILYKPTDNAADVARHARRVQTIRPDLPGNADGSSEWPYNFGVGEHVDPHKAWVVEGRGVGRSGAHTAGWNSTRYGVVIFGDRTSRPLTPGMVAAIRRLGGALFGDRKVEPTMGHRDTVATGCPGSAVYDQLGALQPPFALQGDDDMPLSDEDIERIWSARLPLGDGNSYPARNVLGYIHAEITRPDLLERRLTDALVVALPVGPSGVSSEAIRAACNRAVRDVLGSLG
jgi:hypothetical protein